AELIRCSSVFDDAGNFCPAFNDITEKVEVDQVILAIGQAADLSFADDNVPLKIERGLLSINEETQQTDMPGIFAGGDVAGGPGAIIDAIAAGRRAATSIDKFLGGDGVIDETLAQKPDSQSYDGKRERGFADLLRAEIPTLPLSERHDGFAEVDLSFDDDQAINEANRCLHGFAEVDLSFDDDQAINEANRCLQCDLELRLAQHSGPLQG
ncbi:MAG: FAD-dependent oxidoreductase, partial [Deltaproteobacteria bacterium]|nr:FAD-dependent oxidoreductase [Deltaproteobacteria bacterium]